MGIKEKEIELETLKREIAQAEASLEQDFIKHMVDKTSEKIKDLFFSNKPEFYRFVFTEQNNYLREKLTDKVGRAMDLSDEIQRDKDAEEIEKDKEAFLKKHPEIDFNELLEFYETLGMSVKELAKKYKMNENYLRYIKTRQNWVKRRITKDLEEKEIKEILGDKLTEKNMDLFLDTKKEEVKEVLKQSLDHLNLDPIVLEAITETTSDELLLKAMNAAYIKKQILFCAVVARGELIKMIKKASLSNNEKDSANIIVAAEKVSKLFIDAGVSLFGKEQIQVIEANNNNNVTQMNMSDLLALANSSVNSESGSGGYGSEAVESEASL